jgi:hypothetical protein
VIVDPVLIQPVESPVICKPYYEPTQYWEYDRQTAASCFPTFLPVCAENNGWIIRPIGFHLSVSAPLRKMSAYSPWIYVDIMK